MIPLLIEPAIAFDRTKDTLTTIEYKIREYDAFFQEHITPAMFKVTMLGLEAIAQSTILFWRASLWTIGFGRTVGAWYASTKPTPKQPLLLPSVSSALAEMDLEGRLIQRLDRAARRQAAILSEAKIVPEGRGLVLAPVPSVDYWAAGETPETRVVEEAIASTPAPLMLVGTKRKPSPTRSQKRKTEIQRMA